ncbi:MAG: phage major tail tube protein [Oscillospiraceae bacterium]|nr:phage major tail tube protein [Oscillospiraceae bacterium]
MKRINETIISFAVYENATEYHGMAEVGLPQIAGITNEVSGAGIGGNYESVVRGHFQSMTLTLNFRTLMPTAYKLLEPRNHQIELRLAQQGRDVVAGKTIETGMKHVFVCEPKALNPGKVAPASPADASGEYAVTYWATFIDGIRTLEIDILNLKYEVNGVDYLAKTRELLGKA